MALNYDEAIEELNQQEADLLTELETVRAGRAAISRLKRLNEVKARNATSMRFAGMGAKEAALAALKENAPSSMTTSEVYEVMAAGGWTTGSTKPAANVSATLSQMRDAEVIKVGEGWKLKTSGSVGEVLNSALIGGQSLETMNEVARETADKVKRLIFQSTVQTLPSSQ